VRFVRGEARRMKRSTLARKTPMKQSKILPRAESRSGGLQKSLKAKRPKSTPLRKSANGEGCTLNIAGVCNYNPKTVSLAHLPRLGDIAGMGRKVEDFCACYACDLCHSAMDGRSIVLPISDWYFYAARALVRTLARMVEAGLITIKGLSSEG